MSRKKRERRAERERMRATRAAGCRGVSPEAVAPQSGRKRDGNLAAARDAQLRERPVTECTTCGRSGAAAPCPTLAEIAAELRTGLFLTLLTLTERGMADGADPDGLQTVSRFRRQLATVRRLLPLADPQGGREAALASFAALETSLDRWAEPIRVLARPDGVEFGDMRAPLAG